MTSEDSNNSKQYGVIGLNHPIAVKNNLIAFNPAERAALPPVLKYKGKAYTEKQA